MPEMIAEATPKARKAHWCFDCGRQIPKGVVHHASVIKGDGFYTLRSHADCHDAAAWIVANGDPSDYWDGVPPLSEMIEGSGEWDDELNRMRGLWPHVVCRLELTQQLLDLKYGRS